MAEWVNACHVSMRTEFRRREPMHEKPDMTVCLEPQHSYGGIERQ